MGLDALRGEGRSRGEVGLAREVWVVGGAAELDHAQGGTQVPDHADLSLTTSRLVVSRVLIANLPTMD